MAETRIGVLRGGPSTEYDVSLKTGASVLRHLPDGYRGLDILLAKDGVWHMAGVPSRPEDVFRQVDVIFNALHGEYGEDGKVQQLFEQHRVPYTGSGPLGSALGMNKVLAKDVFKNAGLRTPAFVVADIRRADTEALVRDIYRRLSPPWVLKPISGGSSIGVTIARLPSDLFHQLEKKFLSGEPRVLVEELVFGREATCGVIDDFRGERNYALPPVEILPKSDRMFFDCASKYDGTTQEVCPGNFSPEEKRAIMAAAVAAHRALGLSHYSRADFIVTKRGPYILEVNTLPGLTEQSLLPKSLSAVGAGYPDFLAHLITRALART